MGFVVYRSSAGSGKTYTLVLQYIILLLDDPGRFRNILAITFTNKAAAEMKQRVITGLAELSRGQNEDLLQSLVNEGYEPQFVKERAGIALRRILHEYDEFAVGTIDSFMHRVVRTFARDMNIPAGFEVLIDTNELADLVVDQLLDKVGHDEAVTRVLQEFLNVRIGEEGNPRLDDELSGYVGTLLKEESRERTASLGQWDAHRFIDLSRMLQERMAKRQVRLRELLEPALRCIENYGLSDVDVVHKSRGLLFYLRKLQKPDWKSPLPSAAVLEAIDREELAHPKAAPERRAVTEDAAKELLPLARAIISFMETEGPAQFDDQLISRRIYLLALAGTIRQVLDELKEARNVLSITDFNSLVASVVLSEPVPFIYERLGEKYRHFLLDEFQDTSVLQWIDLIPLLENSLAAGHLSLIVGDGKQSIYRWRSGDVRQFLALPKLDPLGRYPGLQAKESLFAQSYKEEVLRSNFRSSAEVIHFNNDFFNFFSASLPEQWRQAYRDVRQEIGKSAGPGRVEVRFLEFKGRTERDRVFVDNVLELVDSERNQGTPLRNVAILCRVNREASLLASSLLERGIGVVSTESVLLGSSSRVNALVGLMEVVAVPHDRVAAATLARHLQLCGLTGDHSLSALLQDLELLKGKRSEPNTIPWLESLGIRPDFQRIRRLPLYDMAEELLRCLRFGHLQDVYLQFFLEMVDYYLRTFDGSLQGFLSWWKTSGRNRSVVVPPGHDAVNILTIHKAKGLEFPVVIYPYFSSKETPGKDEIWVDVDPERFGGLATGYIRTSSSLENSSWKTEYEEEMNLSALDIINVHYVAFTRARLRSYILAGKPPDKRSNTRLPGLGALLWDFLVQERKWDTSGPGYVTGEWQEAAARGKQQKEDLAQRDFAMRSTAWDHRLRISRKSRDYWDDNPLNEAINRGLLVHRVMASVKQETDVHNAIQREVMEGTLDESLATDLEDKVLRIIRHPLLTPHFSGEGKVFNEAEILEPGGNAWRPDRVVDYGSRVVVIDYKSGKPQREHEDQIRRYALILSEMGYGQVEALLAYLPDGQVVSVAF